MIASYKDKGTSHNVRVRRFPIILTHDVSSPLSVI